MRLVLTRSFTIIPRPVSSPFPSSQGFQLSILSKVLPEPDFTDHRVDGADSGLQDHLEDVDPTISIFKPHRFRPGLVPQGTQTTFRAFTHPSMFQLQHSTASLAPNSYTGPVKQFSVPMYDATDPISTPSTTTTDSRHVAPRPTKTSCRSLS